MQYRKNKVWSLNKFPGSAPDNIERGAVIQAVLTMNGKRYLLELETKRIGILHDKKET